MHFLALSLFNYVFLSHKLGKILKNLRNTGRLSFKNRLKNSSFKIGHILCSVLGESEKLIETLNS